MWPDLLNPVWPSLPHSLTWPHSFYSSQHTLKESTRGRQWGKKESVCLNVLFQRSVSLIKHYNSRQWFPNCWNITSHLATVISSLLGTIFKSTLEPPCLCQQHLRANRTHSWVRISWYCRKLPYSVDKSVWEFYPSAWQTLPLCLDLLGEGGEVSVCPHALLLYNPHHNITINNHKELRKQTIPCKKEPGLAITTPLDFSQWLLIAYSPRCFKSTEILVSFQENCICRQAWKRRDITDVSLPFKFLLFSPLT